MYSVSSFWKDFPIIVAISPSQTLRISRIANTKFSSMPKLPHWDVIPHTCFMCTLNLSNSDAFDTSWSPNCSRSLTIWCSMGPLCICCYVFSENLYYTNIFQSHNFTCFASRLDKHKAADICDVLVRLYQMLLQRSLWPTNAISRPGFGISTRL